MLGVVPPSTRPAHSFALPLVLFSAFWGLVGIAAPWFVCFGGIRILNCWIFFLLHFLCLCFLPCIPVTGV
uniref:Uncharacterized protein n=1 Tax=Athene cunicularia TaxID=194338 RepID=A0A663MA86_ATHCN